MSEAAFHPEGIDLDQFWAELDALGARDFFPDGIPDEPPAAPDPRVFFDE